MKFILPVLLILGSCAHRTYSFEQLDQFCGPWFEQIKEQVSEREDRLPLMTQALASKGAASILSTDLEKASGICYDKFIRSSSNYGYLGCYHIAIAPDGTGSIAIASHGKQTPSANTIDCLKTEMMKIDFKAARRPSHGERVIDVYHSSLLSPKVK